MKSLEKAFESAGMLLDACDYGGARGAYSSILDQVSGTDRARAHALRGFAWYQEGHYLEAAEDFTVAIRLQPDAVNTLFLRARCREQLDDPENALADYEAIVSLRPSTADAWEGASLIHRYFGRDNEAECAAAMAASVRAEDTR